MVAKWLVTAAVVICGALMISAQPFDRNFEQASSDYDDPEYVLAMLNRLLHSRGMETLMHPNIKRGLDLGLGRGFSGSQAAKHLMGLSAANFAGGPGRRKREAPMEQTPKALPVKQQEDGEQRR